MPTPALNEQPAWIGVLLIAGSLLPLLAGWRLIRWTTMLVAAGLVFGAVLFWVQGQMSGMWAWITALSCSVLGGALGWFAYPFLTALQSCILAAVVIITSLLTLWPNLPAVAYGLGCGGGVVAGIIGWQTAAIGAMIQTILLGFLGVLAGMMILCRPASEGELLVLSLVVALITLPAGALVQWRARQRELQP